MYLAEPFKVQLHSNKHQNKSYFKKDTSILLEVGHFFRLAQNFRPLNYFAIFFAPLRMLFFSIFN